MYCWIVGQNGPNNNIIIQTYNENRAFHTYDMLVRGYSCHNKIYRNKDKIGTYHTIRRKQCNYSPNLLTKLDITID